MNFKQAQHAVIVLVTDIMEHDQRPCPEASEQF